MDKVELPWLLLMSIVAGRAIALILDAKNRTIRKLPKFASTLPIVGNLLDLIKYQNHRVHDWITEQCRAWRLLIMGLTQKINRKFLCGVNFTILGHGIDSTASMLTWYVIILRHHAEVEKDYDYVPSLEDLGARVLGRALSESLRLNPTVPLNAKEANCNTTLPNSSFLKKSTRKCISLCAHDARVGTRCAPSARLKLTTQVENVAYTATNFPSFHTGPCICLVIAEMHSNYSGWPPQADNVPAQVNAQRTSPKTPRDDQIDKVNEATNYLKKKRENLDEAVTQELITLNIVRERSGRIGPKVGTLYGITTDFKQWVFIRQFETGEIEIDEVAINVSASLETDIEWPENRTRF